MSALHLAARGNLEQNVTQGNLVLKVKRGHEMVVKALLSAGANANLKTAPERAHCTLPWFFFYPSAHARVRCVPVVMTAGESGRMHVFPARSSFSCWLSDTSVCTASDCVHFQASV
eukprot:1185901-Prorocentrum_minimum.AAC.8